VLINVRCPHCEARFQLQADMVGKQIRCPECREVFSVAEAAATPVAPLPGPDEATSLGSSRTGATRSDAPTPEYQTGAVGELIPILSAEVVPEESRPRAIPDYANAIPVEEPPIHIEPEAPVVVADAPVALPDHAVEPPAPREVRWSDTLPPPEPPVVAEIVTPPPAASEEAAGQHVAVWSPGMAPPKRPERGAPPEGVAAVRVSPPVAGPDEEYVRPKRKRHRLGVLALLVLFVLGALVGGGYWLKRYLDDAPERIFAQAHKEYDENHPAQAGKLFEELARDYPSNPHRDEARFFAELCAFKASVFSVTDASNPAPALEQQKRFLASIEDPTLRPFAARDRFAPDIWQTLQKLAEDVLAKGDKVFERDKPDESEEWLKQCQGLLPVLARFRPKDVGPENVVLDMGGLRDKIAAARQRLADIAHIAGMLAPATLSDAIVGEALAYADAHALKNDAAVLGLFQKAEQAIQGRVAYQRIDPPLPPKALREERLTGLLLAPRLDRRGATPPGAASDSNTVFFALARGVLYAFEEETGRVLWAMRVGIDCDVLPLPIPAQKPRIVLVAVNDGTRASLTARNARTGEEIWTQPLAGPCLGQPVVVGQRAYVGLRDQPAAAGRPTESGVILEIELVQGHLLGKIVLGRPLGAGGVLRPGTGLVYFAADSAGVYVFNVERQGPDGARLDPIKVGMIETGHAAGTLRGTPVLANAEADATGPGYLIVGQSEGLDEMKLRAFPLAPPDAPQSATAPAVEVRLPGWNWFPPRCDGEQLALVTDRGEFGLFGINQAGNQDGPLFPLAPEPLRFGDGRAVSRGQVVFANEDSFWVLAQGGLHHLRLGLDARAGLKLVSVGRPVPLGDPLQAPQIGAQRESALVVTQATGSAACIATAVDLRSGAVRWQRQLGVLPHGDPIRIGDSILFMDHNGGLYAIDPARAGTEPDAAWLIDDRWLVASPLARLAGSPWLIPGPDGKSVSAVVPTPRDGDDGIQLVVRRFTPGRAVESFPPVPLPAGLAGNPVLSGNLVVLPLTNGSLCRVALGESEVLEEGPTWRGERLPAQSVCHLAALGEGDFLASDGNRTLTRWHWPKGDRLFEAKQRATLNDRIASPPVVFTDGESARVCIADAKGAVSLWDAADLTEPLRTWRRTGPNSVIPEGPISAGPFLTHDSRGKARIGYVVAGAHLVWLAPGEDKPLWVALRAARAPGNGVVGLPQLQGNRLLLTDRSGQFQQLDLDTGERIGQALKLPEGSSPAAAALALNERRLLAPLTDGTIVVVPTGAPTGQ
jgi:predicted Zn finger-like uncharacterized protein